MKFDHLGLNEPILRAINAEGYSTPTPIQIQAIPQILQGKDLLGCAQTGTGKTAAFALPILQKLGQTGRSHDRLRPTPIRALILSPTRELASQIADSFGAYGCNSTLRGTVVFGGVSQHHQVRALKAGVDILVATPGRLLDLMNQGFIDLRSIEILVLDEADRMLDMGFIHDIRRIVAKLPATRQTLLFSATMPNDIRALANSILRNPVSVQVAPVGSTVEKVEQTVIYVAAKNKPAMLRHYLGGARIKRALVFTRTKRGADRVAKHLAKEGVRAEVIHGNKSQSARERALENFKATKTAVLIATDIASRGIDVEDITHVVNYDIPNVPETYVHRIGRTARAGASGVAVSFCDPQERDDLKAIERLTRISITVREDHHVLLPCAATEQPHHDRDAKTGSHGSEGGSSRRRGNSRPKRRAARQADAAAPTHLVKADVAGARSGQKYGFLLRARGRGGNRATSV